MILWEEEGAVGDPDWTDTGLPDELMCPEVYQPGGRTEYFCTREAGHDGRHVAGDSEIIVAVWS